MSQGKRNHSICGVRLDCNSEDNILKNVLIICSGGYESGVGGFLLLAIPVAEYSPHFFRLDDETLKIGRFKTTQINLKNPCPLNPFRFAVEC